MEEEVRMRIIDTQLPLTCLPIKLISFVNSSANRAPGTFICPGEINKSPGSFQVKDRHLIVALDDHDQLQNDNGGDWCRWTEGLHGKMGGRGRCNSLIDFFIFVGKERKSSVFYYAEVSDSYTWHKRSWNELFLNRNLFMVIFIQPLHSAVICLSEVCLIYIIDK